MVPDERDGRFGSDTWRSPRPAIVQANGILYELPDGSCKNWAFESLTAPYVEGTPEKILTTWITWHHGSSDLPDSCAG